MVIRNSGFGGRREKAKGDNGGVGLDALVVAQDEGLAQVGQQGGHGGAVQVDQGGEEGGGEAGEGDDFSHQ